MKLRLTILLLLFFAWGGVASLRAQDGEVEREAAALSERGPALQALLRRHREGAADSEFTLRVLRGAKDLEAQGLPANPYLLKANEGLAKRVPSKRIVPALDQTRERTRRAGALVDEAAVRGAQGSAEDRRRSILELQSALMSGKKPEDLEASMRKGWDKKAKPNFLDLAEEAAGPGRGPKRPGGTEATKPSKPSDPEFSPGSEKPRKPASPAKGKAEKSGEFRGSGHSKGKPQTPTLEKSKPGRSGASNGNPKGNGKSRGRGK